MSSRKESPPTKQEILKKYRHIFTDQEIDILYQDALPDTEEMRQENCILEFI